MSTVLRRNLPPKSVKNLGWLLRHWKQVEWLGFNYAPDHKRVIDGQLVAQLRDGTVYLTDYASLNVCWGWLNRPVFKGVAFRLVKPSQHENNRRDFTIGDARWYRINALLYADFIRFVESDDITPPEMSQRRACHETDTPIEQINA